MSEECVASFVIGLVVGVAVGVLIGTGIGPSTDEARNALARDIADGKVKIVVHDWPDGQRDVRIVEVKQEPRP